METLQKPVKQVVLLLVLLLLIIVVVKELYVFFPGLLGAITLYILSRGSYFQLIYHRKWKKGWTAGLYLLGYFTAIAGLVYFTFLLVQRQVQPFLNDPASALNSTRQAILNVQEQTGIVFMSDATLASLQQRLTQFLPSLLNDTVNLLLNLAIMLFMLYYMLVHGKEMEHYLGQLLPLKQCNIDLLASGTKRIVKVSALGIPIISVIQGFTAVIGYILFGVHDVVLWGFLTGVFAFFPVVGTMIVWVPLVIYMYAAGLNWQATGLLLYSVIVTGNIDYLTRITLLKKAGHIHPVITVLGVIAGLGLFGFIGLIFGPLLVNYIILLFRIYMNEFGGNISK
ncbi:MAG: AI-2E family transporter [Bacteroidetes bacterium]|nr:AI-2E family transporter [Bacteroidota bacterium]